MKQVFSSIMALIAALVLLPCSLRAQSQEKQPSMEELASKEADRLATLLDLSDAQIFYVDSTLQHDYAALDAELKAFQAARVSNASIYVGAQDKWLQQIDDTYKRIFNEEQWAKYLKSGGARAQKARAKRQQKALNAAAKKK